MKLREFIKSKGMSIRSFSRLNDLNHRNVEMWCRGERMPNVDDAKKIFEATGHEVTGHDFYETKIERQNLLKELTEA
mgnify:CR=1 FL=1